MNQTDLCFSPAHELVDLIRTKKLSATELLTAHLTRIEQANPKVNAIVTLVTEMALATAKKIDVALARGEELGLLAGLPIAHKDLVDTKGIRTTYGSPIYSQHVPKQNGLIVDRPQQADAVTIGKSNTPEMGAGSQTFNPVFGATKNPYDLSKTCGGSSGGAAVALACGMMPIADGSDMGGSLRNPASFCNVVGFRPSPGRVPRWPTQLGWFSLPVLGPMARNVQDVALMLAAIAGPDPRAPISIQEPGERFLQPLDRDFKGVKIAWSRDLGGLPVDGRVTAVLESQRHIFKSLGCIIEEGEPDFSGADEAFKAGRAWAFAAQVAPLLPEHRSQIKETIIWNAEMGLQLTGPQLSQAEIKRTELYHRVREYLTEYEYLILPVSQVPPFDINQEYITEINGVQMETYIDWMKSSYYISATGLPAISVPCGFTKEGLPVGIQIVGRHQADFSVLQLAYAFEQATGFANRRPYLLT